ncbi:helix-turn-helix transcriptional regulator [Sinorhizobium fredii]|uniref:DNA-binding protein n=1 Tax=Rhizobium fredii TaxID=380 RepID=A0A2L0H466_RHIFR|nr:DNA-binding protein [Sinorhizobium fredii]AUX76286.1 hypothetical protein NXT3_CH01714 [Sinorhizobium fredii]
MAKRYLTTRQVQERYGGIAAITVRRWVVSGRLKKPVRYGNRDYFDQDGLDASDREAAAAYDRARALPQKHTPPQSKNTEEASTE